MSIALWASLLAVVIALMAVVIASRQKSGN
jgi:ABC-type Fe3+ transport system permease subunit